jgi:hypothetical protein
MLIKYAQIQFDVRFLRGKSLLLFPSFARIPRASSAARHKDDERAFF